MKNALILHGSSGNSSKNWYPWLKKELEKRDWKVWVPNLPNAEYPDMEEWTNYIFSNKDWEFNEESIIFGHSAGAALVLSILQKIPDKIAISKAILVAGFVQLTSKPEVNETIKGMLKEPFNWQKIKNSAKHFYFIHSNNDRYECGAKQGEIMQRHLGGELIIKPGEDHFNIKSDPKYKEFPLLLELIEK